MQLSTTSLPWPDSCQIFNYWALNLITLKCISIFANVLDSVLCVIDRLKAKLEFCMGCSPGCDHTRYLNFSLFSHLFFWFKFATEGWYHSILYLALSLISCGEWEWCAFSVLQNAFCQKSKSDRLDLVKSTANESSLNSLQNLWTHFYCLPQERQLTRDHCSKFFFFSNQISFSASAAVHTVE